MRDKAKGWLAAATAGFSTRPFNVLGNLASIAGLIVAVAGEFALDVKAIPLAYLCLLSLYLLARYMRQERGARYAEAAQVMERATRRLKEATDRCLFGDASSETFFVGIQESLSAFAEAFTLVTGSNCRACIKEVYVEDALPPATLRGGTASVEEVLLVATIARSDVDESRKVAQEPSALLRENTDFDDAFKNLQPFHAGDLPDRWLKGTYRNSHWTDDLRKTKDYPYVSTIVWPIEVDPPMGSPLPAVRERVIAFLCVDTRLPKAFRPRADVAFGAVFAHALYPSLRYTLVREGGTSGGKAP